MDRPVTSRGPTLLLCYLSLITALGCSGGGLPEVSVEVGPPVPTLEKGPYSDEELLQLLKPNMKILEIRVKEETLDPLSEWMFSLIDYETGEVIASCDLSQRGTPLTLKNVPYLPQEAQGDFFSFDGRGVTEWSCPDEEEVTKVEAFLGKDLDDGLQPRYHEITEIMPDLDWKRDNQEIAEIMRAYYGLNRDNDLLHYSRTKERFQFLITEEAIASFENGLFTFDPGMMRAHYLTGSAESSYHGSPSEGEYRVENGMLLWKYANFQVYMNESESELILQTIGEYDGIDWIRLSIE